MWDLNVLETEHCLLFVYLYFVTTCLYIICDRLLSPLNGEAVP